MIMKNKTRLSEQMGLLIRLFSAPLTSLVAFFLDSSYLAGPVRNILRNVPNPVGKTLFRFAMNSVNPAFLGQPKTGCIGFITQSGVLRRSIFSMMIEERLGLSKCVVFDQRNAIEWSVLRRIGGDTKTRATIVYIESVQDGRAMMDEAKEITKKKPIIVFKAGKTEAGSRGVSSHTGLLAGSDEICRAAFKQSGMLQANTLQEIVDFAKAFVCYEKSQGFRVGILTNGGGLGIVCADACIGIGLEVPRLNDECQQTLMQGLVFASTVSNPIDLGAAATARDYQLTLEALLDTKAADILIIIVTPTPMVNLVSLTGFLISAVQKYRMPIIVCAAGGFTFVENLRDLTGTRLPIYSLPEEAAAGAFSLAYFGKVVSRVSPSIRQDESATNAL